MLILGISLGAVAVIVVVAVGLYWLAQVLEHKDTWELNRYLRGEDCQWERTGDADAEVTDKSAYFINHAPESQGIEMRVYEYDEPSDGSQGDNEGVCLSIIDRENRNGMILNGFALHLEAMQFGDTLWNDHFLGDSGIMERMITEKRGEWDQMQQEIIIGHYSLFM